MNKQPITIPMSDIAEVVEPLFKEANEFNPLGKGVITKHKLKEALKPVNEKYSSMAARGQKISEETYNLAFEYITNNKMFFEPNRANFYPEEAYRFSLIGAL